MLHTQRKVGDLVQITLFVVLLNVTQIELGTLAHAVYADDFPGVVLGINTFAIQCPVNVSRTLGIGTLAVSRVDQVVAEIAGTTDEPEPSR